MKKTILSFALVSALFSAAQASGQGASVVMLNPNVDSHLDGKVTPLALKSEVPLKATVVSSEVGNAQLMLDDSSLISIAPSSEISLLEYVDEPGDESIAVSMATGSARFVTGEINRKNPKAFVVNTPNSTIGIRGTIVSISCDSDNTSVYLTETSGAGVTITNKATGETTALVKPGNVAIISPGGIEQRAGTKAEADALVARFNGGSVLKTTTNTQNGTTQNSTMLAMNTQAGNSSDTTNSKTDAITDAEQKAGENFDPTPPGPVPPTPVPPTPEAFDKNKVSGSFNGKGENSTMSFDVALGTAQITNGTFSYTEGQAPKNNGTDGTGTIKNNGEFEINNFTLSNLDDKTEYEIDGIFTSLGAGTYSISGENDKIDQILDQGIFGTKGLDINNISGTFEGKGQFSTLSFMVDLNTKVAKEIAFTYDDLSGISFAGKDGVAAINPSGLFTSERFVDSKLGTDMNGISLNGAFGSMDDGAYNLSINSATTPPLTDSGKFSKK